MFLISVYQTFNKFGDREEVTHLEKVGDGDSGIGLARSVEKKLAKFESSKKEIKVQKNTNTFHIALSNLHASLLYVEFFCFILFDTAIQKISSVQSFKIVLPTGYYQNLSMYQMHSKFLKISEECVFIWGLCWWVCFISSFLNNNQILFQYVMDSIPCHIMVILSFFLVVLNSVAQSCPTLCDPVDYSMSGFPVCQQLLRLAQTHVHQVSDAIHPSHPLLSPSSPAFNLSQNQGLFQWVSSLYQVAKAWIFSFSISPSYAYSGLISFRINWFDLLAVQGTLKCLLQQFKSINSSSLSFLYSPTSQPCMTAGKTIALTWWTFVGKVIPLLFNVMSASAVRQSESTTHVHTSPLPWIPSPFRSPQSNEQFLGYTGGSN